MDHKESTVNVCVRARPLIGKEKGSKNIIKVEHNKIKLKNIETKKWKPFCFDYIFDENADQNKLFDVVGKSVITDAYDGYNTCIFAYGNTGSGKTFTMMGDKEHPGLIPNICKELFNKQNMPNTSYRVELSYLEIYQEKIKDLLNVKNVDLTVRQHPKLGPYVQDLSQIIVENDSDIQKFIAKGNAYRHTASTNMNQQSSRSHALLTLTFTQIKSDGEITNEIVSRINLVDLAGNERVKCSKAEGLTFDEAVAINKSLSTLGLVINKLSMYSISKKKKKTKRQHIPFRNSKLTWILADSLGGNSKTHMIANISPSDLVYRNTLDTLRFATSTKSITNKVHINYNPTSKLIQTLKGEIANLKNELRIKGTSGKIDLGELERLRNEIKEREKLMQDKQKTWEEKLHEQKSLTEDLLREKEEREQHVKSLNTKIKKMQEEANKREADQRYHSNLYDISEEYQKKQEEGMVHAAKSLQEYYDKKLEESKHDLENQMDEKIKEMRNQMIEEIAELKKENDNLKQNLRKNVVKKQQELQSYKRDRALLAKQIHQLQSRIHSMGEDPMEDIPEKFKQVQEQLIIKQKDFDKMVSTLQKETEKYHAVREQSEKLANEITALENKQSIISHEIENDTSKLNGLKANYIQLRNNYVQDKKDYQELLLKRQHLNAEINELQKILQKNVKTAKEKLANPTLQDFIHVKDSFDKIFEKMKTLSTCEFNPE